MEYKFLENVKYASTHEWIRVDGDVATLGITDYAQHQLSDVVYVEFPEVATAFDKGDDACVIESAKAAADLVLPISGEIIEINETLADQPELINSSPFDDGWILKLKLSNPSELDELLNVEEYKDLVRKELEK
jgi:glycine cleavage system H protein